MKEVSGERYKYLGVLQNEVNMNDEMKRMVSGEYFRRLDSLLKSKLNAGNLITGVNSWVIGVVRYSAGIFDWRKDELVFMDRKTRKMMAMKGAMKCRGAVERLYVKVC